MPLVNSRDVIVRNSQLRYGTPRATVEKNIAAEWQENEQTIQEKAGRRDEKPLTQVLRPEHAERPRPHHERPEKRKVDIDGLRKAISESLGHHGGEGGNPEPPIEPPRT